MKRTLGIVRPEEEREEHVLHSASLLGDSPPGRVLLTPWGVVESSNGSFVVDEESARLALEAFEDHGTDLPIDYEHQTLGGAFASPSGRAPAAGWIKRIRAEPGVGILADIEWTPQAAEMLATKQYRYLSPVAVVRKADRKLIAVHSAALTNKPAIVGMSPIVNREACDAGAIDVAPLDRLRADLGLDTDADADAVLIAASRRLAAMDEAGKRRHVEERVREALRAGKLVEAQRAWAEALVAREENLFDEWLACAPVIVRTGATAAPPSTDAPDRRVRATAARARSEYRSNRLLSALTSEEAYVADAVRVGESREAA